MSHAIVLSECHCRGNAAVRAWWSNNISMLGFQTRCVFVFDSVEAAVGMFGLIFTDGVLKMCALLILPLMILVVVHRLTKEG